MFSLIRGLITGAEKIDLNGEFERRTQRVQKLKAGLKEDPGLIHSIDRENRIVRSIERKLERGETSLCVKRGESLYDKLIAG